MRDAGLVERQRLVGLEPIPNHKPYPQLVAEKKTPVLIAVEKRGHGMGRVRFAHIPDTSADSRLPPIKALIDHGSVVCTDGHTGYNGVAEPTPSW